MNQGEEMDLQEIRARALTAAVHSFPRDDVDSDSTGRQTAILQRADAFRRYIEDGGQ